MIPEAYCPCPAARNPGTQNLTEHERKRTDVSRHSQPRLEPPLHLHGFRRTRRGWDDSARNLVTWISKRLSTTHRTPGDINLELAQRISSSLHHDFARASPRRVRLTASGRRLHDSGAPTTGGQPGTTPTLTLGFLNVFLYQI